MPSVELFFSLTGAHTQTILNTPEQVSILLNSFDTWHCIVYIASGNTSGEAPKSTNIKEACFHSLKLNNRQLLTSQKVWGFFFFGSTQNQSNANQ